MIIVVQKNLEHWANRQTFYYMYEGETLALKPCTMSKCMKTEGREVHKNKDKTSAKPK